MAAASLSVATSDGSPQTDMKPYSILIHGSGPCGEGSEQSADIALNGLLQHLQTAGHKFESVSMVIDGGAVPIIGALKEHPGLADSASPDAVTLVSISKLLANIDGKLTRFISYEKKDDAAKKESEGSAADQQAEAAPKP